MNQVSDQTTTLYPDARLVHVATLAHGQLCIPIPYFVSQKFGLTGNEELLVEWGGRGFQVQFWGLPKEATEREAQSAPPRPLVATADDALHPPAPDARDEEVSRGEFGLLAKAGAHVSVQPGAGFIPQLEMEPKAIELGELGEARPSGTDTAAPAPRLEPRPTTNFQCATLQPGVPSLERRSGVPEEVYEDGLLEHPAIPGLMLSKDERLYSQLLEIADKGGVARMETLTEKRFRIKWQRPIPEAETASKKKFVQMNTDLFGDGR